MGIKFENRPFSGMCIPQIWQYNECDSLRNEKKSNFYFPLNLRRTCKKNLVVILCSSKISGGGGGGGGSELTGRRGCAILALEVVPKNLNFA